MGEVDSVGQSPELTAVMEALDVRLDLAPGCEPWSGHMSRVWSVRDGNDRPLVLKVGTADESRLSDEAVALRAWQGHGVVELVADHLPPDTTQPQALLLERLDGDLTLESEPDVDAAVDVIVQALLRLHSVRVPDAARSRLRPFTVETRRVAGYITERARAFPGMFEKDIVERALNGLELVESLYARTEPVIVHWDLHFHNLLAGGRQPWTVIDPLPYLGLPEVELVPLLRNRWQEAAAAGDLRRELDRRVDRASELGGIDGDVARRFAQAVAVDNIGWMRETGQHQTMFHDAYVAMLDW